MAHRWRTKQPTAADAARRRKYAGPEHRKAAAEYKRRQQAGEWLTCWRGQHLIPPTLRCHVGHDDHDTDLIRGPECPPCNLKAGARAGNRAQRANRRGTRTGTERAVKRRALLG